MDITSQTRENRAPENRAPENRARENRARENREYVRKLLRERQPDFAVVLESVAQGPRCPACLVQHHERDAVSCI